MANEKITDLPPTTAAALTDLYEKVNDPGGTPTSEKITFQQILNGINLLPATLLLGNGNISMINDGSASFATSKINLNADGGANFASGGVIIDSGGEIDVSGNTQLEPDGSASFANGGVNLNANGSADFAASTILLNADASASFSNGIARITSTGAFISGSVGHDGDVEVHNDTDVLTAYLAGVDGTGHFAADAIVLGNSGGSAAWIDDDGSASFATGNVVITAAGGAQFGDEVSIGGAALVLDPDGSASFANGNTTIAASGQLNAFQAVIGGGSTVLFNDGHCKLSGMIVDVNSRISVYGSDNTVANGVSSIVGFVNLSAQNAAITTTTLFIPPIDGLYRVSVVQQITTSSIAGLLTTTIGWTDLVGATTAVPAAALATTATGRDDGSKTIYAKSGVPITYAVSLTTITTQVYALSIIVERLS